MSEAVQKRDMSLMAIIRWAGRQRIANKPAKNVLNAVATYADRTGTAHPSQRELAAQTGYSERAVRMALAMLEADGFLERVERRRGNGSRTSDSLILIVDRDAHNRHGVPVAEAAAGGTACHPPRNPVPSSPARDSGPTTFEQPGEQPKEHSGGVPPAPPSGAGRVPFRKDLFDRGVRTVRDLTGRPEVRCRALVGSWLGLANDDAAVVLATIDAAAEGEILDAAAWIEARLRRRRSEISAARGGRPGNGYRRESTNGPAAILANLLEQSGASLDLDGGRNRRAMAMAERGEWPVGGSVFVAADSPEGDAWEAYYRRLGQSTKWKGLAQGLGSMMPSAMPPGPVIDHAAAGLASGAGCRP